MDRLDAMRAFVAVGRHVKSIRCRSLDFTVRTSSPPCYVHPELTTHGTVKRMPSRSLWLAGTSISKAAKRAATGGGLEFPASQRNHEWQRRGEQLPDTVRQIKCR